MHIQFGLHTLLLVFVFAAFSCKKDNRILDTSLQPGEDLLSTGTHSAFPVTAVSQTHSTIDSYNNRIKFLGTHSDPLFGRTTIGLYLNTNFTSATFGQSATLDSAHLVISIANADFIGDNKAPLTFSVFPLDSALIRGRVYSAGYDILHQSNPLPTMPQVSVSVEDAKTVLRIPIDQDYAAAIFSDKSNFANLETFQSRYKGFYLLASETGNKNGVIWTCDLEDPASGLYWYYKEGQRDSVFRMSFAGEKAVRYNTVKYDRSTASPALVSQLNGGDNNAVNLFVQGMGGTKAHVDITLADLSTDSFDIAVNRAELVLHVDPALQADYDVPPFLSLLPVGANGRDTIAADQYNTTDNARYNGLYDAANKRYVFNIARHVQAIMTGKLPDRGFSLVMSNPSKAFTLFRDELAGRLVLGGPLHPTLRPTFTLYYSKVRIK